MLDVNISRIEDFIGKHLKETPPLEGGVPPFSSVEFSNNALCNRRCVFCPRVDTEKFPNKDEHLSFDLFKRVIEELSAMDYSGRISFSGFCEPLMTKDLERYIETGKKTCPRMTIEISTNGDYLDAKRIKSLFSVGLSNVRVSLYDGLHQDEKFQKLKKEANLDNKEFIIRRRYLPPEEHYGLTICNRAGSITLENDKLKLAPLKEPLSQPCYYPFYKLMVDYDGQVMICSNDWFKRTVVGDLNRETLKAIWDGDSFNEIRKELIAGNRKFQPCDLCDVHGLYNGRSHFEAWIKYFKSKI